MAHSLLSGFNQYGLGVSKLSRLWESTSHKDEILRVVRGPQVSEKALDQMKSLTFAKLVSLLTEREIQLLIDAICREEGFIV